MRTRPISASTAAATALLAIAAACGDTRPEPAPPRGDPPPDAPPPPVPTADAAAPPTEAGPPPPPPPPAPTATDGIKNGTETDVDCGGPAKGTPRCALGSACLVAGDCATRHCAANQCAILAPSCTGASGTVSCGLDGDDNCCASSPVPGGSYNRFANASYPATISSFKLDRYEVTVGRLRAFFEAKSGNLRGSPPAPGAGAHPKVPNSGWRSSFNARLPGSWSEINDRLGAAGCTVGGDNTDGGAATWTSAPGPYESLPINCIDWYTLFAFCAWDGGRLPTDAEWGYAAMGGNQQRLYAWSDPSETGNLTWGVHDAFVVASLWDASAQVYKFSVGTPFRLTDPVTGKVNDGPAHMSAPGRKKGYGRWGQADLTGNVLEMLLDNAPIPEGTCNDCAFVDWPDPPQDQIGAYPPQWFFPSTNQSPDGLRSTRGGSWDPTHVPYTHYYYAYNVARTYYAAGGRCARD